MLPVSRLGARSLRGTTAVAPLLVVAEQTEKTAAIDVKVWAQFGLR